MNIILNETEWAEDAIYKNQTLGKNPSETLQRVARYYIDQGLSKNEVRKYVEKFLLTCDPGVSIPKWSNTLDRIIRRAAKRKAVDVGYINITEKELEIIESLDGRQLQRLAFSLLCLSKYWNIVNDTDTFWVNNKDNEVMAMANINTSLKRQGGLYMGLKEAGLLEFSKKVDNTNVRVLFARKSGKTALKIYDFRNLGYQYLMYHGEPYFECANCGIVCKYADKRNRKQKYCAACAYKVKLEQNVNYAMRRKKKHASQATA